MKTRFLRALATTAVLAALSGNVFAENSYTYKWKSSDGEIHYTDRPPASGIPFEKIRIQTRKGQAGEAATKSTAKKADAPEDDTYSGWRKENCKRAIQNLDILENASRIAQDDGQGGTRLMSEEEKQEKMEKMQKQKDKYCTEDSD